MSPPFHPDPPSHALPGRQELNLHKVESRLFDYFFFFFFFLERNFGARLADCDACEARPACFCVHKQCHEFAEQQQQQKNSSTKDICLDPTSHSYLQVSLKSCNLGGEEQCSSEGPPFPLHEESLHYKQLIYKRCSA